MKGEEGEKGSKGRERSNKGRERVREREREGANKGTKGVQVKGREGKEAVRLDKKAKELCPWTLRRLVVVYMSSLLLTWPAHVSSAWAVFWAMSSSAVKCLQA
jgi:hypothetical protein